MKTMRTNFDKKADRIFTLNWTLLPIILGTWQRMEGEGNDATVRRDAKKKTDEENAQYNLSTGKTYSIYEIRVSPRCASFNEMKSFLRI